MSRSHEGRSMYCGEPGHFVSVCLRKPPARLPAHVCGPVSGFACVPVRGAVGVVEAVGGVEFAEFM